MCSDCCLVELQNDPQSKCRVETLAWSYIKSGACEKQSLGVWCCCCGCHDLERRKYENSWSGAEDYRAVTTRTLGCVLGSKNEQIVKAILQV